MLNRIVAFFFLGLATALTGCSTDDSPTSPSGSSVRTIKANPSFAADIQEILDRRGCTAGSCHGSSARAGLDLRSGNAYGAMFNVDAQSESFKLVLPNNAQDSYLVIKLEGRQSVGSRMPVTGEFLDSIDIQNIRNWIDQGAHNN